MKTTLTRRQFIQRTSTTALAAAAFPTLIPASALGRGGHPGPQQSHQRGRLPSASGRRAEESWAAFWPRPTSGSSPCATWQSCNLEQAVNQVNQHYQNQDCKTYGDFRELLARTDIDAVLIATPDHWHVPVAIAAARAGKDMYVEKPMGLSLAEDQMLRKVCQQNKRIFQFGTQQRSSQRIPARVRTGPQRPDRQAQTNQRLVLRQPPRRLRPNPCPLPTDLDYDFWLGPAPYTPVHGRQGVRQRSRPAPGRPGGSTTITRSASSPAGACIRWTSPIGAIRR